MTVVPNSAKGSPSHTCWNRGELNKDGRPGEEIVSSQSPRGDRLRVPIEQPDHQVIRIDGVHVHTGKADLLRRHHKPDRADDREGPPAKHDRRGAMGHGAAIMPPAPWIDLVRRPLRCRTNSDSVHFMNSAKLTVTSARTGSASALALVSGGLLLLLRPART